MIVRKYGEKMSSDPKLVPYILPLVEGAVILDVGCGRGKWGYLLKVDYWYTKVGRRKNKLNYVVGTDLHPKYLEFVKYHRVYDGLVLCDARHLPFRGNAFDTVLLLEVIEHMVKNEGVKLLKEAERVATRLVLVSTPSFFMRQEAKDANVFQKHLSKWTIKDFIRLGYSIRFGSFPLERIYNYLQYFFIKLLYVLPQYPVSFIAIKYISTAKTNEKGDFEKLQDLSE
jgi:ubiquinone/menaquinone biosynthesis C-methylase UbiE